ncbi:cell wall-active antibiotics response protein [Virgibacillus sp. MSP4-1]|uniref:cell wall-active antibiotics response protein LiaF n=1 Tax=Virgibacillus sp. MSP4-1 TaxID=2700081 RepID=UPI0003A66C76|nr:cell wall-active antibiotics response protein LiaF [Virgibacillus sp. MSP4-1]QHS21619.1 cell wall-active antibiotics response protein [Virgibacillus sp. MSP4-1]
MKPQSLVKVLLSFLLIAAGIFLILENIGIISVEISNIIAKNWPILLIVMGLKWFVDSFRDNKGGSWAFGSFLAIYASLVVLGNYGVLAFGFGDIWALWPLLLIYIGLHFLFFTKRKDKKGNGVKFTIDSDRGNTKNSHSFVGSHNFNEENWTVEPLEMWSGVGDYYFDFTKAYIPNRDTPITIKGWVGDVRMLMPEDVALRIDATASVGDIKVLEKEANGVSKNLVYQSPDYEEAVQRLTIHLHLQVGDIRIDRV